MSVDPEPLNFVGDILVPMVARRDLTRESAHRALRDILGGSVDPLHVAAFLSALTTKGETTDEMTGFVEAMSNAALTFRVDSRAVDIVGTGGDRLNTVNVSTMASFVVAGCGVPVAKHGNRAASSSVGAADVLEELGVNLLATAEVVSRCISSAGIGFMYAPTFHPALAHLGPVRRSLGFRTIFNVLGPLANPAQVRKSVIGVAQEHLLEPMANVVRSRNVDRVILVRGDEGLDELSLETTSTLWIVEGDLVTTVKVDAGEILGRRRSTMELVGGDAKHNATVVRRVLGGEGGAVRDVVVANAALALVAAGVTSDIAEGILRATASIDEGHALRALDVLILESHRRLEES